MYITCPSGVYYGDSSSLLFCSRGLQKVAGIGFKEGRNREGDGGDAADGPIREKVHALERESLQILIQYEKCARTVFIYDQSGESYPPNNVIEPSSLDTYERSADESEYFLFSSFCISE